MNDFTANRLNAGAKGGGRFTYKTNSESDAELEPSADIYADSETTNHADISADEIRVLASSPDHVLRSELPGYPNVPEDVLEQLQGPDQTVETRQSVLATMYPGVAARGAKDRHPLVRAHAMQAGWDLSEQEMSQLQQDPAVQRVIRLTGD